MARITVEDCIQYVNNTFELIMVASQRAKELGYGSSPVIDNVVSKKDKDTVIALKEIAEGKLNVEALRIALIKKSILKNSDETETIKKDINEIEQETIEDIKSLEVDVSVKPQKDQIYQDEENIEET